MNEEVNMLSEALKYTEMGFSIIPVGADKKPLVSWKEFQTRKASREEIEGWFMQFPEANLAVVTGAISGVVVIDVEIDGDTSNLTPTVISKTGGGGWHFYYRHPGYEIQTRTRIYPSTDIRADGGYAILPPSLHTSGKRYEWSVSPEMTDYAELPALMKRFSRLANKIASSAETGYPSATERVNLEGTRNDMATRVVGKMLNNIKPELWEMAGWPTLKKWNESKNQPPLSEKELRSVWDSITKSHAAQSGESKSGSQKVLKPVHISTLMAKVFAEPEWTVAQLVPSAGITAISGSPASYKTWLMLELTTKVASGESLFGKFTTAKGGVLIVDEENGERMFNQRFNKLSHAQELNIHILSLENFKLNQNEVSQLLTFCRENAIKLVIFDSLVRIHSGNENDAMEMSEVATKLKQFNKEGITVIFTHHNRKQGVLRSGNPSQDMRGSSDILASVDCHLAIERKEKLITVHQTKLRHMEEIKPFQLNVVGDDDAIHFEFAGELDIAKSTIDELKNGILDLLTQSTEPMYKGEIFESLKGAGLKGGHSSFKMAIEELIKNDGPVLTTRGEKNKVYCSLRPVNGSLEGGEET